MGRIIQTTHAITLASFLALLIGCPAGEGGGSDDDDMAYADDDDVSDDDDAWGDDDYGDDDDMAGDDDDDDTSGDDDDTTEPDVCDEIPEDPTTLYLSADDSNSQAAPALARQQIRAGGEIHSRQRPYEYLNYYDFDFAPAAPGHLDISAQGRIDDDGNLVLLLGVAAPSIADVVRRPRSLTFSVDSSGSMSGHAMDMVKASMTQMAHNLHEGDIVSILSWDSSSTVLLHTEEVSGPDDPQVLNAIASLSPGGSTDLEGGLSRAYDLADQAFDPERLNRVILLSDGGANTGVTSETLIADHAEDGEGEGVYMVAIGMDDAAGSYNDRLMDAVSDLGKGAYVYIDTEDEAGVMFGDDERFLTVMEIAAREVQLEMVMPAGYVMEEFHGEEYSEDPSEVEPQHLAPGDAMLFHQILTDCTPDAHDGSEVFGLSVRWIDPVTRNAMTDTLTLTATDILAAAGPQLTKADVVVDYALGLAEVWYEAAGDREAYLDAIIQAAETAYVDTGDADLQEIATLLTSYRNNL
jgi:Ca-activated chloride channel homolog